MKIYEVPRQDWTRFLHRLAREHRGRPVAVESIWCACGARAADYFVDSHLIARDVPLETIWLEPLEEHLRVVVQTRGAAGEAVRFVLESPCSLFLKREEAPEKQTLRVNSATGQALEISFPAAVESEPLEVTA